ncbi:MAG: hypothetical protein KGJ78_17295 [Alphaproteobacteria bacterium]|nr:hypothetical protein [Alphaproteobacteria bacterium]
MEELGTPKSSKFNALMLWGLCVAVLLGPSVLVWTVRGAAYAANCAPGPQLCQGMPLGGGLRDALDLAWSIDTNMTILIGGSIIATLAAFFARKPMLGTLSLLLLPILSPVLPMLAVLASRYPDCPVSTDGIGSCLLWGSQMGMTFHTAAGVQDIIYAMFPYTFSLTLMLGLLGWFFARPREHAPPHAMAQMRRMIDDE